MQNQIKISVVIPVYNAEKFLDKCLEHIIHQTYKNLEIIIIDDGSRDNSPVIYNKYAKQDKRIKIKKQKNSGPAVALNTGLSMASGDYIHFHDHDDYVNLDYFEIMVDAAKKTNSDVLCGEVNQPDYNFPLFDSIEICTSMEDKILKTRANRFTPAWRYVYKKEFLDRINLKYETGLVFGSQDYIFTRTAIVLANSLALVPGAKYNVIDTPTALGKNKPKIRTEIDKKIREKFSNFLHTHGAFELMRVPELPFKNEELKIFNICILRKEIYIKKIRYYLFGIKIGTKKFNP